MNLSRRKLFSLAPAFLAAPAIIRVAALMPIRPQNTNVALTIVDGKSIWIADLAPGEGKRFVYFENGWHYQHVWNNSKDVVSIFGPHP